MTLKERITEDMKSAMRAGEKDRLGVVRLILAAIKQREVDERITLDDAQVLAVLEKMAKQRKESMSQFESGGRADLVAKEAAELVIVQAYMPAQLSDADLENVAGGMLNNLMAKCSISGGLNLLSSNVNIELG